jgi:hypothetical protein
LPPAADTIKRVGELAAFHILTNCLLELADNGEKEY